MKRIVTQDEAYLLVVQVAAPTNVYSADENVWDCVLPCNFIKSPLDFSPLSKQVQFFRLEGHT